MPRFLLLMYLDFNVYQLCAGIVSLLEVAPGAAMLVAIAAIVVVTVAAVLAAALLLSSGALAA